MQWGSSGDLVGFHLWDSVRGRKESKDDSGVRGIFRHERTTQMRRATDGDRLHANVSPARLLAIYRLLHHHRPYTDSHHLLQPNLPYPCRGTIRFWSGRQPRWSPGNTLTAAACGSSLLPRALQEQRGIMQHEGHAERGKHQSDGAAHRMPHREGEDRGQGRPRIRVEARGARGVSRPSLTTVTTSREAGR